MEKNRTWKHNIIFTEWWLGTSRMTELTQLYLLNDDREFWRQNGITKHNFTQWIPRTYSRTAERKHECIYCMTAEILKTKGNILPNTIYSQNKGDRHVALVNFSKRGNCTRWSCSWEFQRFEKLTRANWFQIKLKTVWLPTHNAL